MIKKFILIPLAFLLLLVGAAVSFLSLRGPAVAKPSSIAVEMSAKNLERGKYLYQHLMHCNGCHGDNDYTRFANPVKAGRDGAGFVFPKELGLAGTINAPNITPDKETGIGNWSDGEKIRAIREGISKDGRALFPMMPYREYRKMTGDDVYALVAYMNSLPAVKNFVPPSSIAFPVSLLIKSIPQPVVPVKDVDRMNRVKYGEYLVALGGCRGCHTPDDHGQPIAGKDFSGGHLFNVGFARVVSANISKDEQSGIGRWSETQFVEKFAQYRDYAKNGSPKIPNDDFTLMAWVNFSQLPDEDLRAIYTYFRTQPAIYNAVDSHPDKPKNR